MRVRLLALAALLAAAPPALGQGHEHGQNSGIVIAHDVPDDGVTFAGNLNHFAVVVQGDDPRPDFHQQMHLRATLNGVVLLETTPDSGHDYDGVNAFDVVFPVAGEYLVEALGEDGMELASFAGTVEPAPAAPAPGMEVSFRQGALGVPPVLLSGSPVVFEYRLQDGGETMAHTDTWFEVWRDGRLEFRTKTHTHADAQETAYTFPLPGAYTVRLTAFLAYPSEGAPRFLPVAHEESLLVLPGPPAGAPPSAGAPVLPPTDLNAVIEGDAPAPYLLVGTYDPYTLVGPDTLQHLYALVLDAETGAPVPHVDFTATLASPLGVAFRSETLHEYDGILEVTTRQPLPGVYALHVTASTGDWTATLDMAYLVAPPVVPLAAGPATLELAAGPLAAGVPGDLTFTAQAASGPFAHSEIEYRILPPEGGAPVAIGKLHTHDDGLFRLTLALPQAGEYRLEATPFSLMPEPVVAGGPYAFGLAVGEGPGLPTAGCASCLVESREPADGELPGPGPLLAVGLLALALAARRGHR